MSQHYTFLFWSPHLAEPVSTYIICMCLYKVVMYLTPGYFSHEFHNNYFRCFIFVIYVCATNYNISVRLLRRSLYFQVYILSCIHYDNQNILEPRIYKYSEPTSCVYYINTIYSIITLQYYCAVSKVYFFCGFMLAFVNWFIAVTFFNVYFKFILFKMCSF